MRGCASGEENGAENVEEDEEEGQGSVPRMSRPRPLRIRSRAAHASIPVLGPVHPPAASNAPGFLLSVCFLALQLHLARVLQEISTSTSFFRDHGCPRDGRHLLAPPGSPQAHGEARVQRGGLCRAHGRPTQVHLAWDVQGRVRSRLIPLQTSASTSLSAMSVAHSSRASLDLLVHFSRCLCVL